MWEYEVEAAASWRPSWYEMEQNQARIMEELMEPTLGPVGTEMRPEMRPGSSDTKNLASSVPSPPANSSKAINDQLDGFRDDGSRSKGEDRDGEDARLHSVAEVDVSSPIAPAEGQLGEESRRCGSEAPNAPDLASSPAPALEELGREEVGSSEEEEVNKEPEKEGNVEEVRIEVAKETKRKQSRPQRKNGCGEDWGPHASERAKELKRARARRYYLNKKYREAQKSGVEYVPREGGRERDQRKRKELEDKYNSILAQSKKEEGRRKQEKKEKMIEKRKRKKVEEELKEERDQTKITVRRLENIVMEMAGKKGRDGVYSEQMECPQSNKDDISRDTGEVAVPIGGIKTSGDNQRSSMLELEGHRADDEVRTVEREAAIEIASAEREAYEHSGETIEEEAAKEDEMVKALVKAYDDLTSPESEDSEKKGRLREGMELETNYGVYNRPETPYGFRELWPGDNSNIQIINEG